MWHLCSVSAAAHCVWYSCGLPFQTAVQYKIPELRKRKEKKKKPRLLSSNNTGRLLWAWFLMLGYIFMDIYIMLLTHKKIKYQLRHYLQSNASHVIGQKADISQLKPPKLNSSSRTELFCIIFCSHCISVWHFNAFFAQQFAGNFCSDCLIFSSSGNS